MNEIKKSNDPTLLNATFIILDFEKSHHNAIIPKEVGLELAETIMNKPIVADYVPVEDINTTTDNFTGHAASIGKDKHGNETIIRDTVPIGVFTSNGYILTISENGIEKEVLAADATLWKSRFMDACELIVEWFNRGININTSSELLYSNYIFQDGIEYIQSPIYFEGHCILASENRGDQNIVLPAYDSSRLLSLNEISEFHRMIAQAHHNLNSKKTKKGTEGVNVKFQKMFELSFEDIRSKIYQAFDPTLPEDTYSYIIQTFDDRFIVEIYSDGYKTYEYKYSKEGDDIVIDFDSKVEVVEERKWVAKNNELEIQLNEVKSSLESVQNELQSKSAEIETLLNEKESLSLKLNEVNEKLVTVATDKEALASQNYQLNEQVTQLNSQVEILKPYKEKVEEAEFNLSLNEKKEFYLNKFNAFSAVERFNSEEVQNLIVAYAKGEEEAKIKLNSILVDLVEVKKEKSNVNFEQEYIREFASKNEDLIPENNDFDSKYK